MGFQVLKLIVLLMSVDLISCEGYFVVVSSNLLRHQSIFHAAISSQGYDDSHQVLEVAVRSSDKTKAVYEVAENVTLSDGRTQYVEFDLRDQPLGDYNLEVKSVEGAPFEKFARLNMNTKKNSIFIQTDKAIYKPADNVQFRVVFVDSDLRPLDPSEVSIYITDASKNRVKQYEDIVLRKGVYENELKLSELAIQGIWKINVKVDGAKDIVKEFEVKKYTLPTFEMKIDTNPNTDYSQGKIRATVLAKYTFGKIAKGTATVRAEIGSRTVFPPSTGGRRPSPIRVPQVVVTKTVEVDGKKPVEFDMDTELQIKDKTRDTRVSMFAVFKEELTGREVNATAEVVIRTYPFKIELKQSANKFKPGLPFTVTAVVKSFDKDAPITDSKNPLEIAIQYFYDKVRTCQRYVNTRTTRSALSPNTTSNIESYACREIRKYDVEREAFVTNGIVVTDIEIPSYATRVNFTVNYQGLKSSLSNIQRLYSESNQYIQIKSLTEKPTLSQNIKIEVRATENLHSIVYQVIGKSNVIATEAVEVHNERKFNFEFTPSFEMLPSAKLVVHYVTATGEIVSDSLTLEFGNELRNKIDITLSQDQAKPGETVKILVKTAKNSLVALLGVDQSVLLLKSGNDIDQSQVSRELQLYNQANVNNNRRNADPRAVNKFYPDFQSSSSIVITNAKDVFQPPSLPTYRQFVTTTTRKSIPGQRTTRRGPQGPSGPDSEEGANGPSAPRRAGASAPRGAAGPRGPSGPPQEEVADFDIRTDFPETWMFDSFNFNRRTSQIEISKKVPDSITSWIITGFSVDPKTGLGLTNLPSKLTVFRPFFVSANLPYSIKRGEVVSIPVLVFNYMDKDEVAEITLLNSNQEFEFVADNADPHLNANDADRRKSINTKAQSGVTVNFLIRPLKVGHITIKVIGTTATAGDGFEKQLIVEPEGITQYMNRAVLIDLRNTREFKSTLSITVPANAVPDSTKIEASAIGDVMGPSLENLDRLIQLPGGCGEQNMLGFVPNIVAIEYLTILNKLTPELGAKAKLNMEKGYQGQLAYKRTDGSYSAFGMSDPSGSTWLTAYVAKFFHQASKYIAVDKSIITLALDFLSKTQAADGSFPEVGRVIHSDMQGESSKGLALTAYTLATFLENSDSVVKYDTTISKALDHIVSNINKIDDVYTLAVVAYTLQLVKHSSSSSVLKKLDDRSVNKDGLKFWEKPVATSDINNRRIYRPSSVNVEMSAYGLQALLLAGQDSEAIAVMRWLVTQRNAQGGFASTQDTVVGLQALAKLAAKIYTEGSEIDISVEHSFGPTTNININEANALVLQKFELPSEARDFDVTANGRGMTILQIAYQYNVDNSGEFPRFKLAPRLNDKTTKTFIALEVCTSFIPDSTTNKSNMALIEVTFPSGFTFDAESLPELSSFDKVKRVERKNGETMVVVYFDDITTKTICPVFKAYRVHNVALQKPASVAVLDYYDNSRTARAFYSAPDVSLCDICTGDDCKKMCPK